MTHADMKAWHSNKVMKKLPVTLNNQPHICNGTMTNATYNIQLLAPQTCTTNTYIFLTSTLKTSDYDRVTAVAVTHP